MISNVGVGFLLLLSFFQEMGRGRRVQVPFLLSFVFFPSNHLLSHRFLFFFFFVNLKFAFACCLRCCLAKMEIQISLSERKLSGRNKTDIHIKGEKILLFFLSIQGGSVTRSSL